MGQFPIGKNRKRLCHFQIDFSRISEDFQC